MSYVKVEILGGQEQLDRYSKLLAGIPDGLERAQFNAMKRAGERAKTHAGRFAAARYEISKGGFDRYTQVKSAAGGTASISITFCGEVIPLKQFTVRSSAAGVYAKVKNGGNIISRSFFGYASHGKSMGGNVFRRVGASRLPIKKLFGPAGPSMLKDEQVQEEMHELITETYEERMEHEVLRLMNGW